MRWFFRIGFHWKIALPIILVTAISIVLAINSLFSFNRLSDESRLIVGSQLPAIEKLLLAEKHILKVQVAERSVLFTSSRSTQFKELVEKHKGNISKSELYFDGFIKLDHQLVDSDLIKQYKKEFTHWKALTSRVLYEREHNGRIGRSNAIEISFKDGLESLTKLQAIFEKIKLHVFNSTELLSMNIDESSKNGLKAQIVGIISALLVGSLSILFFPRLTLRPILNITKRLQQMSEGNGDFSSRLPIDNNDAIAKMSLAFNKFVDLLQMMMSELTQATIKLSNASDHLVESANSSEQSVYEQQNAVDEINQATEGLLESFNNVVEVSSLATEEIRNADQGSVAISSVMTEAFSNVRALAGNVQQYTKDLDQLEEDTDNIASILDIIDDIAGQTGLLALNAAIEAARAGEQGRGFAVVADEVRTLSKKTHQSTESIKNTIDKLHYRVGEVVKTMHVGHEIASQTVGDAEKVEASMTDITQAMHRINQMSVDISSATNRQLTETDGITHNMAHIVSLSQETASRSKQAALEAETLQTLSNKIRNYSA